MLSKLSLCRRGSDKSIEALLPKFAVSWYVAQFEGALSTLHDPDMPA